eukprot:gene33147-28520_t
MAQLPALPLYDELELLDPQPQQRALLLAELEEQRDVTRLNVAPLTA